MIYSYIDVREQLLYCFYFFYFFFVACLIGTFDQNCDRYCQCQNGNCDQVTGNCTCNLGWTGTTCNNFSKSEIKFTTTFLIYLRNSCVINAYWQHVGFWLKDVKIWHLIGPTLFCSSGQRNRQRLDRLCFCLRITLEYIFYNYSQLKIILLHKYGW